MTTRRMLKIVRSGLTLIVICLALHSLPSNPLAQAHAQRSSASTKTRRAIKIAAPGFYFEVSPCVRCYRCRPCPLNNGWQRKFMRLLRASGIESFPGESSGSESAPVLFESVGMIKRFAAPKSYDTNIYVGPFESENAARASIAELCSVLNEVGVMESSCEDMATKSEGSTLYTRGSFDVSGIRVLPKRASN